MKVESLANMQVRSMTGVPIELSNIVHVRRGHGPSQIEREARQRQITVLAGLEGLTLGEATKLAEAAAKRVVKELAGHRLRRRGRHHAGELLGHGHVAAARGDLRVHDPGGAVRQLRRSR